MNGKSNIGIVGSRALVLCALATSSFACSWTSDGGITARYESSNEITKSDGVWNNEAIDIANSEGSIQVVGVAEKKNITVYARFVAGANSQADAEAAFADVASGITIEKRDGRWRISCPHAKQWHGSADPIATGCSSLRVEVPAGTLRAPIKLNAVAGFGGVHVRGVTVSKLYAQAPFGIVADVVPTAEAQLVLHGDDLIIGMCSSVLRIPEESTLASVSLTVDNANVKYVDVSEDDQRFWLGADIQGFANGPAVPRRTGTYGWSRGAAPFAASQIDIHASLGKALLTTKPVEDYRAFNQCESMKQQVSAEVGLQK
jgi:hypothetical protein